MEKLREFSFQFILEGPLALAPTFSTFDDFTSVL